MQNSNKIERILKLGHTDYRVVAATVITFIKHNINDFLCLFERYKFLSVFGFEIRLWSIKYVKLSEIIITFEIEIK